MSCSYLWMTVWLLSSYSNSISHSSSPVNRKRAKKLLCKLLSYREAQQCLWDPRFPVLGRATGWSYIALHPLGGFQEDHVVVVFFSIKPLSNDNANHTPVTCVSSLLGHCPRHIGPHNCILQRRWSWLGEGGGGQRPGEREINWIE